MQYTISFRLASDATFGRGDGVPGIIDREVEHDEYGLPFLRGRTLKGLLSEEADNLLFVLGAMGKDTDERWTRARNQLFGRPGSRHKDQEGSVDALVRYGHAQLPASLRRTIRMTLEQQDRTLGRQDVLTSLTAVRRQTAVDPDGLPHEGSLRTMRVILRQTPFISMLNTSAPLPPMAEALLAATVLAFRRAGTGRNRGRGRLEDLDLCCDGSSILQEAYRCFVQEAGL